MSNRLFRGASALLVALLLATPSSGTILIRQDLAELLKNSEAVVRAKIVGGVAGWDSGRRLIWTTTTFDVTETWKGTLSGRAQLRELGGVVGTVGMRVVGAPQYAVGEDLILFLYRDALGHLRTTGWTQGRLSIEADAEKPDVRLAVSLYDHVFADYFKKEESRGVLKVEMPALKAKASAATPPVRIVKDEKTEGSK